MRKEAGVCAFPSSSDLSTQENTGSQKPAVTGRSDERDAQRASILSAPTAAPSLPNKSPARSSPRPESPNKAAPSSSVHSASSGAVPQNQNSVSCAVRTWSYWNNWDANGTMAGIEGHDGAMAMEGTTVRDTAVLTYAHEAASTDHGNIQSNARRWLALAALACMWTNAQAPLFMFGMSTVPQ